MKNFFLPLCLALTGILHAQLHPSLMLTTATMGAVRKGITEYPLLKSSFTEIKRNADNAIKAGINVPLPNDGGGGVTHEQHKKNYQNILACGISYQVTKDERYAHYVKDILLQYAAVYKTWPRHPKRKQVPGGKIFWQNLNDCVWQVYVIQGYDCVYDYLSVADRKKIEADLFEPIVKELSEVNEETFDKIHNHGTWSVAAVGMTGYVCQRKEWIEKALHGTNKDDKSGFMAQLNELFSPDGYYTEGPYYQRYAILPFLLFAKAINQYQPELHIYNFRDGVLKKAVDASLQTTYTNGAFFPVNDAMKDKTFESEELVYGVDIAYSDMKAGADLLDVARKQNKVIVSDAGLKVAKDLSAGKIKPFEYKPTWLSDGADGKQGGLGILRSGPNDDQTCVVLKAAAQGMGHGHFDRLNMLLYDNNTEVFSDYGAVRFLNIETKNGGNYTKTNDSWGKQTIAHNTVVADKISHYRGEEKAASQNAPVLIYFDAEKNFQVVGAKEDHAYNGISLLRTLILFTPSGTGFLLLIDIYKANSKESHQYDLPFWYQGHITDKSFPASINTTSLRQLGDKYGYQHIWLNGEGRPGTANGAITFLNNKRFYTTTFLADTSMHIQFVTSGAGDSEMDLRNEKAFILSEPSKSNQTFLSITEPHGNTDTIAETTSASLSKVKDLKLLEDKTARTVFEFVYGSKTYRIELNYNDHDKFIQIK
ncbi:MAG: Heparinase family protein [Chitinophagaceae bacterium]|nr:Heparinase family protein [Chitinophagaceae bacterium]